MSGDRLPDPLPPLLGGILVGGASRRMATAKALLVLEGKTFVERIAQALAAVVPELCLFGSGVELPAALAKLDVVPDDRRASGPLAALLAAFEHRPGAAWLMLSCDQPLLSTEALVWLVAERRPDRIAVLPRLQPARIEPFPGIYEPGCRPALAMLAGVAAPSDAASGPAERRPGSLQPLARFPGVHTANVPPALAADFLGANTPQELAALRSRVEGAEPPGAGSGRDRDGKPTG